ncbi:MAG: hemolysin III family protein [Candidatus Omnitrophota bacterium]|nr:hemolysin III family protein [Candidatus Omnitrophota bacterium]
MPRPILRYPFRSALNILCAALSLAGLIVLVCLASAHASVYHIVSFAIYGTSLTALWSVSAAYHTLGATNRTLEQWDHAMIYFLIAGTYTPICLVVLKGGWGWSLFGVNWGLAAAGITLKLAIRRPARAITVLLFVFYILMGWLVAIAWGPLTRALPAEGVAWLVWGGIFYTFGAAVLNMKFLDFSPSFGSHDIWHLFVAAGSFCHYWLMVRYVMELKP